MFAALLQYMNNWATAFNSSSAMPAIESQLSNPKSSALSVNSLLSTLLTDYAIDTTLSNALISLFQNGNLVGSSKERPTMANAQESLSILLQDIMDTVTSDWASGNFQAMAKGGMLLNSTGETAITLTERLKGGNLGTGG